MITDQVLSKFNKLAEEGMSPEVLYQTAKESGLNEIDCIFVIRRVFGLDFLEAKSTIVRAKGLGENLSEYQAKIAPIIAEALEGLDLEDQK